MTSNIDRVGSFDAPTKLRRPNSVVVVSRHPHASMLDALLGAGDYDVVFIESLDHAYSQIKRSNPQVVVMCLDMDDAGCFQVLSMLTLDSATSRIPIITYVAASAGSSSHDQSSGLDVDQVQQPIAVSMN
jgi:CheY-like chemotaxis protein